MFQFITQDSTTLIITVFCRFLTRAQFAKEMCVTTVYPLRDLTQVIILELHTVFQTPRTILGYFIPNLLNTDAIRKDLLAAK